MLNQLHVGKCNFYRQRNPSLSRFGALGEKWLYPPISAESEEICSPTSLQLLSTSLHLECFDAREELQHSQSCGMELELTRKYTAQYTASISHRNMDTCPYRNLWIMDMQHVSCCMSIQQDTLLEHVNEAQSDELN